MKISEVKELIQLFNDTDVRELEFQEDEVKLILKKGYPIQTETESNTHMSYFPQIVNVGGTPLSTSGMGAPLIAPAPGFMAPYPSVAHGLPYGHSTTPGTLLPVVSGLPLPQSTAVTSGFPPAHAPGMAHNAAVTSGLPFVQSVPVAHSLPLAHNAAVTSGLSLAQSTPLASGVPLAHGTAVPSAVPPTHSTQVASGMVTSGMPISPLPAMTQKLLKAPMVGTFYRAPRPDAEPFVKLGDRVKAGQTVCIIEAMKLMNQIEAEFGGIVVDILLKDGDPVEYGQTLFVIEPDEAR